jgi:DNA-binding XRE family transcriptional regulator
MHQIEKECYFENIKLRLRIAEYLDSSRISAHLRMTSNKETVLTMGFGAKDGIHFTFRKISIGSSKSSSICNPMRQ